MFSNSDIVVHWTDRPDGSHWFATVRVRTPDDWFVEMTLSEQDDGVIVSAFKMTPAKRGKIPRGGITSRRHLRKIELMPYVEAASASAKLHFGDNERAAREMVAILRGKLAQWGGRPGLTDLDKAKISIRWEEVLRSGRGRKQLAAERSVETPSIGNRLTKLRKEGWIEANPTPPPKERASDRAYRVAGRTRCD